MVNIKTICNGIKNLLMSSRVPRATLPAILMVCSAINRPGVSIMNIVSRIISRQGEAGVGYGPMADGSANGYEAMVRVIVEEVCNAWKYESKVQASTPIGGISFLGTGANAGGPVTVTGINIMPFNSFGING